MSSWRDQILMEFTPNVSRLTLVADPDGLLLEEGILESIKERGFELIPFEDHIAFRYAYESRFRSHWDRGEQTDLVVVLRSQAGDLGYLPYDLLQAGRKLSFNLGVIFPNLSYPIVNLVDKGDLDALYEAQYKYTPGQLGDNATKDFVLRHVYEIAVEQIKQPSDLLRMLLRRHYRGQRVPKVFDERLIQLLRQSSTFDKWSLERIVPDREAFFAFLQERWSVYLEQAATRGNESVKESEEIYGFEFQGPAVLPFEHDDIRIYIDNLFTEGQLKPILYADYQSLANAWLSIGIRSDRNKDNKRRIENLNETLVKDIGKENKRHSDWFHIARKWAELVCIAMEDGMPNPEIISMIKDIQAQIDPILLQWLNKCYAGLINLPPSPPVMLHHIPRFLARSVIDNREYKAALILVDGLSLDQWIIIKNEMTKKRDNYLYRETSVFAWVPTITSVSRQAVFAGKPPIYYPDSIHTTDKEPVLWAQFWSDQGLLPQEVTYTKGLGDGSLNKVKEIVNDRRSRMVALIIDKVDKIMHGMELGTAGMHNQVRQWAGQPFMVDVIDMLLDSGFCVYLTSDHGNIESSGCGRPSEGAVADLRGERVRIYSDPLLRDRVKEQYTNALEWQPVGLPEGYLPLLAPGRNAFIKENESIVCHGGVSIEEIIVPFVQIEKRHLT